MSAYLKRLQIDSVEESSEHPSAYLKRVDVVEVVDQDGNPWEPVPGPDPWDALVVTDKALYHESNIYEIGETVYATTATYTGGDAEQTVYRWRWQWRQSSDGAWANAPWNTYDNTLKQVSYVIPNGGQIRFQCQARDDTQDPVTQVNSFTTAKTVPFPALVVGTPVVSGLPFVGETVTCPQPTVSGGVAPYTYVYTWKLVQAPAEGAWSNGSTVIVPKGVVGNSGFCEVAVEDAVGTTKIVSSNPFGPIEYREFGDISVTVNGTEYDHTAGAALTILMNDPVPVVVSITGDATPTYSWEARNDYPLMIGQQAASTVLTFPQEGIVTVTCTLRDTNTEEINTSVVINFYVVDAFD